MQHPLFNGFHVAEKERGIGADVKAMGLPMNLKPTVRGDFTGKKGFSHPFRKTSAPPPAWPIVRRLQPLQAVEGGNAGLRGNMIDFHRGKSLEFHRVDLLDREALDRVFAGSDIDAVIHFAGLKAVKTVSRLEFHSVITITISPAP